MLDVASGKHGVGVWIVVELLGDGEKRFVVTDFGDSLCCAVFAEECHDVLLTVVVFLAWLM